MIFITEEIKNLKCIFECKEEPIGIYHVPEGCACWPDVIQALCAQHFETAESNGPITLIVGNDGKKNIDGEVKNLLVNQELTKYEKMDV